MATAPPHAFLCQPLMLAKPWGGHHLSALGETPQNGEPWGEAWLVADLEQHQSTVAAGPLAGHTMARLRQAWGEGLGGTAFGEGPLPLLIKIIDAREPLSVQVHPSQAQAPGQGKEESWVILRTTPEGAPGGIYRGLAPGVTRDDLSQALKQRGLENLLRREEVFAGDTVDVPPGTVHAILGGVTVLEVQEPSDVTWRLYDHGRPRPLHTQQALAALSETPPPPLHTAAQAARHLCSAPWGTHVTLLEKPAYRIEKLMLHGRWTAPPTPHTLRVVVLSRGSARVENGLGGGFTLLPWQALVIPAAAQGVTLTATDAEAIVTGAAGGPLLV